MNNLPDYNPRLFLNRRGEIKKFEELIDQVASGQAGLKRVLVFNGERGIGKSWLLRHFHYLAQRMNESRNTPITPFLIRLRPKPDVVEPQLQPPAGDTSESVIVCSLNRVNRIPDAPDENDIRFISMLLYRLENHLVATGLIQTASDRDHSAGDLSYLLTRQLERSLGESRGVLVLLVDSVYEADWKLVRLLEEYVLAPLVALDRVAVVLSGRGQPFPWVNSLLRAPPVEGALERWEKPSADDEEGEQLGAERRKWLIKLIRTQCENREFWHTPADSADMELNGQQEDRLEEIWERGQGHLLLTLQLASHPAEDDADTLEHFLKDNLFGFFSEGRRQVLRACFEALSVLDQFREPAMEEMLRAYWQFNHKPPEFEAPQTRKLLTELQQTHLLRWDRQQSQYFVDDTVRITLSAWLQLARPELWKALHEAAQGMYERWAVAYKQHKEYYLQRAQLHGDELAVRTNGASERTPHYQQSKLHTAATA